MRTFFRGVFYVLVLLIVAMVSALTTMRYAIHGREVAVPQFVGLTPQAAQKLASQNGLLFSDDDHFYSNDIAEGLVVSQSPKPGTRVRRGWHVRVADSLGPQRIDIPSVVGQSSRAAEMNAQRHRLEIGTIATLATADFPADQVLAQDPAAGAQGIASPRISLLVAAAPDPPTWVMPDFTGSKLANASVVTTDAGMKVKTVLIPNGTPALPGHGAKALGEAIIVRQSPVAGQRVTAGTVVTFGYSHRLPESPIPSTGD